MSSSYTKNIIYEYSDSSEGEFPIQREPPQTPDANVQIPTSGQKQEGIHLYKNRYINMYVTTNNHRMAQS